MYLLEDLLLSSYSVLLLLDKPVLDALDLGPYWIQVIIMILDSVVSLLIYLGLEVIHPFMISRPLRPYECTLLVDLMLQVISKIV